MAGVTIQRTFQSRAGRIAGFVCLALLSGGSAFSAVAVPTATPTYTPVASEVPTATPPASDKSDGAAASASDFRGRASGAALLNLAAGQSATQSSTAFGGDASRAVDGDTSGVFGAGSVTHTANQIGSWWEVDLGVQAHIDSIEVWNREGCCQARLSNYLVMVSRTPNPQPGAGGFEHLEAAVAGRPTTIPIDALGRYVRIQKLGGGALSLAEVRVLGQALTVVNLAAGRPASQSSTAFGGSADRAVDSNTDGIFGNASVTHTANQAQPWWEVDLGAIALIETIDVWNRAGCCQSRLSDYSVLVSTSPNPEPDGAVTFQHLETATAGYPTSISVNAIGRYVRIQKMGGGALTLAEVQVWGEILALTNLAEGQPTTQSSTAFGGVSERAVDGDTNGFYGNASVTHTLNQAAAWWEVDLGFPADIVRIDLWNRDGCCQSRLSDYYVLVSASPNPEPDGAVTFQQRELATAGYPTSIQVDGSGRYVRIQKAGTGPLSLAEVQVWGVKPDSVYVAQVMSPVLTAGETASVSLRFRNSGGTAWSAAEAYVLAAQSPADNATWGVVEVPFEASESIAPGEEKTFDFTITAPSEIGDYDFQWQLRRGADWFGEPSPLVSVSVVSPRQVSPYSLRFMGNGTGDTDRVKIRLDDSTLPDDPGPPADIGSEDFTLEFWLKGAAADNDAAAQTCGENINWINGNIVIDRDRYNQDRKFGLSIAGGVPIFGVSGDGTGDRTICGGANVSSVVDDQWHHVAVQRRRSDGHLWLFVDGSLESEADGPDGDVSYPDDAVPCADCCGGGSCDFSDPFLVVGAEKHDAGASFPSFNGYVDEIRLSSSLRYGGSFTPPTAPFSPDANTVGLYHFDEGNGDLIADSSGAVGGPSSGDRRLGGAPPGPLWSTDTPFPASPSLTLSAIGSAPSTVVAMANAGDHRLFLATRDGQILIYDGVQIGPTPFLDIESVVGSTGSEQGLLGLAFHPEYAGNGHFFVNYTDNGGSSVVARYSRSAAGPDLADPDSGVVLLTVPQPAGNHNGGQIAFGADGMLYIGLGDGGGGGDPSCYAQRDDSLLGKMLRIDVDQNVSSPPYHGIPADNPFVGPGDPLDEIWAEGLRNPWRFTFDRLTGGMFIADVGQRAVEEVSYQSASSSGGENYGWKVMEGSACYILDCPNDAPNCNANNCPANLPACNDPSLVDPILEYTHSSGCSITGGYVYRGRISDDLYGSYLYGDFCTRSIWVGRNEGGAWASTLLTSAVGNIYSFGEDSSGTLYLSTGTSIFRVQ